MLLTSLVVSSIGLAGEGSAVGNGGGRSENALMLARAHYQSLLMICLQQKGCGTQQPLRDHINFLLKQNLPTAGDFRFKEQANTAELIDATGNGIPYFFDQKIAILTFNREFIYSPNNDPLRLSTAVGYLTRIYLDLFGRADFSKSSKLVKPIENLAKSTGEQLSVGKDTLQLPFKKWIRLQTIFSGLVIESSASLLSLSCPDTDINKCSLKDISESNRTIELKNLSLVSEKLNGSLIEFEVQGHFINGVDLPKLFTIHASFENGIVKSFEWMGQALEIPQ